jgi:hypothetical protein
MTFRMAEGGSTSLLPQPITPVDMKVFQGGGEIGGGNIINNITNTPPMDGGTTTTGLLAQPADTVPLQEFRGGGDLEITPPSSNKIPFRGMTTEDLQEFKNFIQIQFVSSENDLKPFENKNSILTIFNSGTEYIIPKDSNKIKLSETNIVPLQELFFFGVKGGELDLNDIPKDNNIHTLFYTTNLKASQPYFTVNTVSTPETQPSSSSDVSVDKRLNTVPVQDVTTETTSETSEKIIQPEPILEKEGIISLSNNFMVRYITNDLELKKQIMNFQFVEDEQKLFEYLFPMNQNFVTKYLKDKEEFFTFWKLFVNNDLTNNFSLMTFEEVDFYKDFYNKLQQAYREELQQEVKNILLNGFSVQVEPKGKESVVPESGTTGYNSITVTKPVDNSVSTNEAKKTIVTNTLVVPKSTEAEIIVPTKTIETKNKLQELEKLPVTTHIITPVTTQNEDSCKLLDTMNTISNKKPETIEEIINKINSLQRSIRCYRGKQTGRIKEVGTNKKNTNEKYNEFKEKINKSEEEIVKLKSILETLPGGVVALAELKEKEEKKAAAAEAIAANKPTTEETTVVEAISTNKPTKASTRKKRKATTETTETTATTATQGGKRNITRKRK